MITLKEYNNLCWWCGQIANSREHSHKKSDFKRVFGLPPYSDNEQPIKEAGEQYKIIQGPKSKEITFDKVLCEECNNTKSQPFDRAYDIFIEWIDKHPLKVLESEIIDFRLIFGEDYIFYKNNVMKYYIKHFCCRLAENSISISEKIIDFLNGKSKLEHLIIKHETRIDSFGWEFRYSQKGIKFSTLAKGKLEYCLKRDVDNEFEAIWATYNYKWFRTYFQYSEKIESKKKDFCWYDQYNKTDKVPVKNIGFVPLEKYFDYSISEDELYELFVANAAKYSHNNLQLGL